MKMRERLRVGATIDVKTTRQLAIPSETNKRERVQTACGDLNEHNQRVVRHRTRSFTSNQSKEQNVITDMPLPIAKAHTVQFVEEDRRVEDIGMSLLVAASKLRVFEYHLLRNRAVRNCQSFDPEEETDAIFECFHLIRASDESNYVLTGDLEISSDEMVQTLKSIGAFGRGISYAEIDALPLLALDELEVLDVEECACYMTVPLPSHKSWRFQSLMRKHMPMKHHFPWRMSGRIMARMQNLRPAVDDAEDDAEEGVEEGAEEGA